ncbi:MAG: hypothetical protein IJS19_05655 [Muribaculaceae bacterium]|nr:hypothetical protein [Muribaculaceae bacterium]
MDKDIAKPLNSLARHKMIVRLLADIALDLQVCELEGWDKREYIAMLHKEIDKFYQQLN